jgi:hypothetical protein
MSQTCPYCRFTIPSGAIVCGHCGAEKRTIVTEPYDPEIQSGLFTAIFGLAFGIFLAWSNDAKFTGYLIGAVLGFIGGWFMPLLNKLFQAAIGAGIGLVIGILITSIFSLKGTIGIIVFVVCAGLGGLVGYFYEKTEDQWFR